MDPNKPHKKWKGGAEKIREKKKQALEKAGESCLKVTDLFTHSKSHEKAELKKTADPVDESNVTCMELEDIVSEKEMSTGPTDVVPGLVIGTSANLDPVPSTSSHEVLLVSETSVAIAPDLDVAHSTSSHAIQVHAQVHAVNVSTVEAPGTCSYDGLEVAGTSIGIFPVNTALTASLGSTSGRTSPNPAPARVSQVIPVTTGGESIVLLSSENDPISATLPGTVAGSSAVLHCEALPSLQDGRAVLQSKRKACSQTVSEVTEVSFCRPSSKELTSFFKRHPCQPFANLPFKAEKAYYRSDGIQRQWLSYSVQKKCLFCTVCLAYSKKSAYSAFIDGFDTWSHTYLRLKEHEGSMMHKNCAAAHIAHSSKKDILGSLFVTAVSKNNEQVVQRRSVLERVISLVKAIGKRGLSYRGTHFESAYTLDDPTVDHGNFLEFLLVLREFDPVIKNHLDVVIKLSKKRHDASKKTHVGATSRGRGSLVTLISKTVVNYVIDIIHNLIQEKIAKDIKLAGIYSIQIDCTQDITVTDQCSIIIRYVTDQVYERLLAIVDSHSGKGKSLFEMVQNILSAHGLDVACCVSDSTDGASNMSGQYNGFTAWLEKSSPGHVHIWCYAHVLNLVMSDTTESKGASAALFALLQSCATYFRESYLRMDAWREQMSKLLGPAKLSRLTMIGATRWWSKDRALRKVFGTESYTDSLFFELVSAFHLIDESEDFLTPSRFTARTLLAALLKYETILMAHTFREIFSLTTPLSKYLQTAGLDFIMAQTMLLSTIKSLRLLSRDMDKVVKNTDLFIQQHNDKCEETDTVACCIETSLPVVRVAKKKRMAGELASDEAPQIPLDKFRIEVYNVVFDRAISSMETRFAKHGELFADFSLFDPKNFESITRHLLDTSFQLVPKNALEKMSFMLTHYCKDIETSCSILADLKQELADFARKWPIIKNSVPMEYKLVRDSIALEEDDIPKPDDCDSEYDIDSQSIAECQLSCKNCVRCAYAFLLRYNLFSNAYSILYRAYKLLLTLSVTQVACERSFSKLKLVKTTARNSLTQDHLEAFMLMFVEQSILHDIKSEDVINILAAKSAELKRLLRF